MSLRMTAVHSIVTYTRTASAKMENLVSSAVTIALSSSTLAPPQTVYYRNSKQFAQMRGYSSLQ